MGYEGLGEIIMSPGVDIAWAKLAKPSFYPNVTITSLSGFNFTPNLFW